MLAWWSTYIIFHCNLFRMNTYKPLHRQAVLRSLFRPVDYGKFRLFIFEYEVEQERHFEVKSTSLDLNLITICRSDRWLN